MGKKGNYQRVQADPGAKLGPQHKVANLAHFQESLARRTSNCAGAHDSRPNRQRSRQDAKRFAIQDRSY